MKTVSALRRLALLVTFLPLLFLSPLPLGAAPAALGTEEQPADMKAASASAAAIELQPQYRQSVLAPRSYKVEMVIGFKALPAPRPAQARAPLNLTLVIDCSGSMKDRDKLNYAKIAAAGLAGQLDGQDSAALVAYGDGVEEWFSASFMTPANRQRILDLISSLRPAGDTDLYRGLEAGFRQMERAVSPGRKRIILLSDGGANKGITDPDRLAALAGRIRQAGGTLTTMGLSQGHDESLMRLLAQRGGGNYHYIRDPRDTELYFAGEFPDIMTWVSKDTTLALNLNDHVLDARVYGHSLERQGREYRLNINNFYGGEERMLIVELIIKPVQESQMLELGSLTLRYQPLIGNGAPESVVVPLRVEISPDQVRQQASINRQAEAWIRAAQDGR